MSDSLIEIKRRIASTKKTSQITKAMQMVSGAKLTRSESSSRNFQDYAGKIRSVVTHLVASQLQANEENEEETVFPFQKKDVSSFHDMLTERPVEKTGYIIITSDKGLVGGYNSQIIKQTLQMIEQDHEKENEFVLMCIGGVGADFFKGRGYQLAYELRGVSDFPSFDEVRKIVSTATQMYSNKVFDELYVCYNHHINSLTSQFRVDKMLPISDLDPSEAKVYEQEYILEPSKDAILDILLPQYAESLIYGAIVDAKTAEHAAGMTAMKSATDNAKNIINDLTITFNRARQAAITQEITEIVGGAEALD